MRPRPTRGGGRRQRNSDFSPPSHYPSRTSALRRDIEAAAAMRLRLSGEPGSQDRQWRSLPRAIRSAHGSHSTGAITTVLTHLTLRGCRDAAARCQSPTSAGLHTWAYREMCPASALTRFLIFLIFLSSFCSALSRSNRGPPRPALPRYDCFPRSPRSMTSHVALPGLNGHFQAAMAGSHPIISSLRIPILLITNR